MSYDFAPVGRGPRGKGPRTKRQARERTIRLDPNWKPPKRRERKEEEDR